MEYLLRLPLDRSMLRGSVDRILIGAPMTSPGRIESELCTAVLDIFSLAFEAEGYELPPFVSLEAVELAASKARVCFDELVEVRKGSGSEHRMRNSAEADGMRRLAYRRCGLPTGSAHEMVEMGSGRRRVLMFERLENRQISNVEELCAVLRSEWDVWLYTEQHDFCSEVRAVQWADVVIAKLGAHVEYVALARRGTVLIVVHGYPLLLYREFIPKAAYHSGIRVLDIVSLDAANVDERRIPTDRSRPCDCMLYGCDVCRKR